MAEEINYGSDTELTRAPAQRISPSFNGKVPGLITGGNIDLSRRPDVANPDGSHSTVRSMSFEDNGKEVLVPTVVGNKVVSDEEAIQHYRQTGEHLGIFDKPDSATAYARQLHDDYQSGKIKNTPPAAIDYGVHDYEAHASANQPSSLKDQANQAIRDTASAVADKLNPISIGKGILQNAESLKEDPIGTLLETFAHPYMALKRAKESYDAAKDAASKGDVNAAKTAMDQAGVHLSSAITGSPLTESSEVKMATPGERATGFGELLGTGIQAYLGAKAPDLLNAAKSKISGVSVGDVAPVAKDAIGLVSPRAAHAISLAQRAKALADKLFPGEAPAEAPTAAQPPPLPAQPPPLPPNQTVPPLPYEATAQGLTDAANQRMLSSMKASQTMAQAAQRAVPPAPAPAAAPVEDMALLNATAKNTWNVPFSKLGRAAQDLIRNAVAKDAAKAAESSAQATPPAPAPQQVPVTQPAVSPEEAPTDAPSVSPSSAEATAGKPTAAEEFAQAVMGKQEGGTIPAKPTAPAETFIDRARAAKSVKVNLISKHMNDVGMTPEKLDELKPSQWRDIAQSAGVELPKDLTATIRDVRQALVDKNDPFVNVVGRGQVRLSTLKASEKVIPMVNQ